MRWLQNEIIRLISGCTDIKKLRVAYAYICALLK